MSRKDRWLVLAEGWWLTGNVWESLGVPRKPDDLAMWECLLAWAGWKWR